MGVKAISAKWFHFSSKKSLNVGVQEATPGVDEYLQDTERVVHIAFPDRRRLQYLGHGLWRAKLRPVTFFTISATPVTDVRTWYEAGALQISSNRVLLDLAGLPPQFHDIELKLDLRGRLIRVKNSARGGPNCAMVGSVDLGVGVDLPLPFSLLPDAAVNGVGNAILEGILVAMDSALRRGLVEDYRNWCMHKQGTMRESDQDQKVQAR